MLKMKKDDFLSRAFQNEAPIKDMLRAFPDAVAVLLFENQMFDSSAFGALSIAACGPSNTFKSVEAADGKWIHDMPSFRQYAVAYCDAEEFR